MVIAHAYLVERYLPDLTAEQVAEATNRTKALARDARIKLRGLRGDQTACEGAWCWERVLPLFPSISRFRWSPRVDAG
jgi:hypothetical protein